nr:hypothetical protein CFP56_76437 [Quercus suber]
MAVDDDQADRNQFEVRNISKATMKFQGLLQKRGMLIPNLLGMRIAFGVRTMVQNNKGEVMVVISSKGPEVTNSEEAEVLVCRKALEFAVDAGFSELVIKGDNISVMKSIASP